MGIHSNIIIHCSDIYASNSDVKINNNESIYNKG